MGLEKVINEVIASAKKEADAILHSENEKRKEILFEAEKKITLQRKKIQQETEEKIKSYESMELSLLRLELKKTELSKKKELYEQTVDKTKKKISNLKPNEKSKFIGALIKYGKKEMPEAKYFICNPKDKRLIKTKSKKLIFLEEKNLLGGFILVNPSQEKRLDLSFDTILTKTLEEKKHELYKILFS